MKYMDRETFENANMFGTGVLNEMFSTYFTGNSFLNPLSKPGESPLFLVNVTFEPGCRNDWHIHHAQSNGGQMLICTAGQGWYQEEGKKPAPLAEGSFVYVPAGVKHWHGAQADSWFSHIAVEIPDAESSNEWLEPVSDKAYSQLPTTKSNDIDHGEAKYATKKAFKKANMFGMGIRNFMLSRYFSGRSYLKMMTRPGRAPLFITNVTFEPGCRNNWHVHHATSGGGQILICTAGEGWYQAEGKAAVSLHEGSIVCIPAKAKHWHGAKADSWFSHIAIAIPGEDSKNEWLEAVSNEVYRKL